VGELTVLVTVPVDGESQQLPVTVKLCANLFCTKSASGGRRYFIRNPKQQKHKYCDRDCMKKWTNKARQ
jgi:hypothetical protein